MRRYDSAPSEQPSSGYIGGSRHPTHGGSSSGSHHPAQRQSEAGSRASALPPKAECKKK